MYLPSDWKKSLTAASIDTPPLQDSHPANPVEEAPALEQSVYASGHGLHNAVPGGPVAASAHGGAGDTGGFSLGDRVTVDGRAGTGTVRFVGRHHDDGMAHFGSISTILTALSWICAGIHMCGALPSPVCA